jgi:hypothetical protein
VRWTRGRLEDCLLSAVSANEAPWSSCFDNATDDRESAHDVAGRNCFPRGKDMGYEGIPGPGQGFRRLASQPTQSWHVPWSLIEAAVTKMYPYSRQYFMWDGQDRRKSHLRDTPVQSLRLPTPTPPPSQVPAGTWQRPFPHSANRVKERRILGLSPSNEFRETEQPFVPCWLRPLSSHFVVS